MVNRQPSATRRLQIVEAALELINDQGVHHLTAAKIAAKVGISDGTIFRHFKNKEEIVIAAMDYFEALMFQDFPPADADPMVRLRSFFIQRLLLLRKHPAILQLADNDRLAEAAGEAGASRMRSMVQRNFAFVLQCLAEAQEQGKIGADISLTTFVWTVTGILRGVVTAWRFGIIEREVSSIDAAWAGLETLLRRSNKA
jgi:AcrR family transcriptional regulator